MVGSGLSSGEVVTYPELFVTSAGQLDRRPLRQRIALKLPWTGQIGSRLDRDSHAS